MPKQRYINKVKDRLIEAALCKVSDLKTIMA
jgi:hypothetical protein